MRSKILMAVCLFMTAILIGFIIALNGNGSTTKIEIGNPQKIKIYNCSQVTSLELTNSDTRYSEILNAYNNSFKGTYLEQLQNNDYFVEDIQENLEAAQWLDYNKLNGLYIEFCFDNAQKYIVYRETNSRQIFITSIIFKITENSKIEPINFYYAVNNSYNNNPENTGDSEIFYPLVCYGNTKDLYSLVLSYI